MTQEWAAECALKLHIAALNRAPKKNKSSKTNNRDQQESVRERVLQAKITRTKPL